jgi:predicted permease
MKRVWRIGLWRSQRELQEEIEAHLQMNIADRIAGGESEQNARQAAIREFGNVPLVQEVTREVWGWMWLERLAQNLRYAARRLRRSPGFSAAAVTIIAAGIAVTTTIYSIVYAVILQPLPFARPNQLVAVGAKPLPWLSLPTIQDWQRGSHVFQSITAYSGWSPRIESSAGLGHVNAELVSQNFAATLGLDFALGHDFTRNGNESDCFGQAIVSYSYWQRMGGGETLANRTIQLDYRTYAVIGVLAPDVDLQEMEALGEPSILTPIGCDRAKSPQSRGEADFGAIGRLYPGVSVQEATAELQTRQRVLSQEFPQDYEVTFTPVLVPLADYISATGTRSALFATLTACGMLLLIACANLINLLFARNMRRRSEFALYATLGATSRRLAGQMLAENGLLSTTGAMTGITLSLLLVRAVTHLSVVHLPRLAHVKVNLPVLGFAGSLTVLIAFLLTLLPALQSLRPALLADLTYGGFRSTSVSFGLRRAGRFLVASQLAMAFVLVASSGWMVSSVFILLHQPLGFEPDHLLIASIDLRGHTRNVTLPSEKVLTVLNQALADVRVLPGVAEVAAANDKPLGARVNRYGFCADLHPDDCKHPASTAPDVFQVTEGYFHTVGQQIYRGRSFNSGDNGQNHVAIVNHALAAEQWPGQDPIGHRIYTGDLHAWAMVAGEVGDVHSYSLERAPVPNLYLPEADGPDTSMTIFARTHGDPSEMDETIRRVLRNDNEIEVRYVESMPELMAHQVAVRQFSMWVISAFGILALALAILGTYALLAYEISVREREIGIRLALGSSRPAIVSLLIWQESPWIAAGMAMGLFGAVLVGFFFKAEFYHVQVASLPVLLASSILLGLPALAAVAIPSRHASLLDPSVTLRQE